MKAITKNLVYFALIFLVGAVIFRYVLSMFLENQRFNIIWIIAVVYFLYNFAAGWHYGKRDHDHLPLYDIGFRFHLATYVIFNLVAISWFFMGFNSKYESVGSVYLTAVFWGLGLILHFIIYLYTRKYSISGINRDEIFE